jgi:hypothetical protein
MATEDEYDEMAVSWSVRFTLPDGKRRSASFGAGKRLEHAAHMKEVPILGSSGFVVPGTYYR